MTATITDGTIKLSPRQQEAQELFNMGLTYSQVGICMDISNCAAFYLVHPEKRRFRNKNEYEAKKAALALVKQISDKDFTKKDETEANECGNNGVAVLSMEETLPPMDGPMPSPSAPQPEG